jgi:hypothetical protein
MAPPTSSGNGAALTLALNNNIMVHLFYPHDLGSDDTFRAN